MKKQERQDRIEQYLRQEMSPAERAQFEAAMKRDAALAEEVRLQQQLHEEFGDRAKQTFIRELDKLGDQYFGPSPASGRMWWNWKWLLGALLMVAVGLWLVIWVLPVPVKQKDIPVPENNQPQRPLEEREGPLSEPPGQSVEPPKPSPSEPEVEKESPPIAQVNPADFTPNPYLENLVGSYVRGEEWQFSGIDAALEGGRFRLEGRAQLTTAAAERNLMVFTYSNREADWLAGNFLLRRPLDLQAVAGDEPARTAGGDELRSFRFRISVPVDWKPGLYYYFLAWEQDEEPLFAGKMELTAD